jgi:hypothetical protein
MTSNCCQTQFGVGSCFCTQAKALLYSLLLDDRVEIGMFFVTIETAEPDLGPAWESLYVSVARAAAPFNFRMPIAAETAASHARKCKITI